MKNKCIMCGGSTNAPICRWCSSNKCRYCRIAMTNFKTNNEVLAHMAWHHKHLIVMTNISGKLPQPRCVKGLSRAGTIKKKSIPCDLLKPETLSIKIQNIKKEVYVTHESKTKLKSKSRSHRLKQSTRNCISRAIMSQHATRRVINLLGADIPTVRQYIEEQFRDGMSWDNYGFRGWHLDHINSCASFDLLNPEEQKKCFHYTNLQPLWWRENISKGMVCLKYQEVYNE